MLQAGFGFFLNIFECKINSTVFDPRDSNDRIWATQTDAANHREFSIRPVKSLIEIVHRQAFGDKTEADKDTTTHTEGGCTTVNVKQKGAETKYCIHALFQLICCSCMTDLWATGCSHELEFVSECHPWQQSQF